MNGMSNTPRVSVIILNYNGMNFVDSCLTSVLNSNYDNLEVVLVDNNSSDGSADEALGKFGPDPRFKLDKNAKNYGFAKGNNIGASHAKGQYLLFLNVDTVVDANWIQELMRTVDDDSTVGAAQCKLLLLDDPGLIDSAGHFLDWFGVSHVRGHNESDHGQYDDVRQVLGATGAAMLIRRPVFDQLGGFDEDFFMLFEEDDLCWRIWITGNRVLYVPGAVVLHKSGVIRGREKVYLNLFLSRRNRTISILKNYSMRNLIRFLPIHLGLVFAASFFTENKHEYVRAFLSAEMAVIRSARRIAIKRRAVQSTRITSDMELMKNGILRKPSVKEMLRSGY